MPIRRRTVPLLLLLAGAGAVAAQEAPASPPAAEGAAEELLTGSRLPQPAGPLGAPLLVLTKQDFLASGARSLGEFLQARPELAARINGQVNNGNDGAVRLDLRSIGEVRTLVLLDGRRFVAGGPGADGAVDLLALPAAAVERIEILLDGASPVYGSGAIAGVVDVITRQRLDGAEVSASVGRTARGDGVILDLSAIVGATGERGGLLMALGLQRQEPVMAGDRDWSRQTYLWDFQRGQEVAVEGNSPTTPDGAFSLPAGVPSAPGPACDALPAGDPVKALCSLPGAGNDFIPNGDGTFRRGVEAYNTYPGTYLVTPSQRIQLFTSAEVRLGGAVRAFAEATYTNRTSAQRLAAFPLLANGATLTPVAAASMYNPLGVDVVAWRRRTVEFGDRTWRQDLDTLDLVFGLDGAFGAWAGPLEGWRWEGSYTAGRTSGVERSDGQVRSDRIGAAVGPSFLHPALGPACGDPGPDGIAGTADDRIIQGCVPLDVLGGAGSLTPAMKGWLGYQGSSSGSSDLRVAAVAVAGPVGRLWSARPASLSLGAEHRREAGRYLPDPGPAAGPSTGAPASAAEGSFEALEGYGELALPILGGVPGVEALELSLAARAFHYSSFGADATWRMGVRYAPVRELTFRAGYGTAFRAPSVRELYGAERQVSFDFVPSGDPCADAASAPASCGSAAGNGDTAVMFANDKVANPRLEPERASVLTLGASLAPRWVPGLTLTIGYQAIDLTGTVAHRGSAAILSGCYDAGVAADCAGIVRGPTGLIESITDPLWNAGTISTATVDAGLRYAIPAGPAGRFDLALDGAFLRYHREQTPTGGVISGAGVYDLGLLPTFRGYGTAAWSLGGLGATLGARYVGAFVECQSTVCSFDDPGNSPRRTVPAWLGLDLSLAYRLRSPAGETTLAAGVLNLLDAQPPRIYTADAYSADPGYPYAGRSYYARVAQAF